MVAVEAVAVRVRGRRKVQGSALADRRVAVVHGGSEGERACSETESASETKGLARVAGRVLPFVRVPVRAMVQHAWTGRQGGRWARSGSGRMVGAVVVVVVVVGGDAVRRGVLYAVVLW